MSEIERERRGGRERGERKNADFSVATEKPKILEEVPSCRKMSDLISQKVVL